ncbi:MAG: hypothetical protein ACLURP_08070 [Ruminococcus sp.]
MKQTQKYPFLQTIPQERASGVEDPDSANEDSSFFSNEEAETTSDFASDESDINEQGFSGWEVSECARNMDTEIADETSIIDYANAAPLSFAACSDIEIDPSTTATCNSVLLRT